MQALSIEDVAGGYRGPSGSCRSPAVLYSEMDAEGWIEIDNWTSQRLHSWALSEDSFEIKVSTLGYVPGEGSSEGPPRWVAATDIEFDDQGRVANFRLGRTQAVVVRCEDKRIRHIPGSYYEGKVTLTFH